jgi:hypothetical protein
MGADEAGTARTLREHREAVRPIIAGHGGRIVKTTGDGVLLEFASVVAAVECAILVQKLMTERNATVAENRRMLFRIGVNLGDVLIDGDDILGDGVNIAARLEGCLGRSFRHLRPMQTARRGRRKAPLEAGVFATPFRRRSAEAERDSRRQDKA